MSARCPTYVASEIPMDKFFREELVDSELYRVLPEDGIKLNQNESPWDLPLDLKVAITERLIKTDWNRYPLDDILHIKKKLAKSLSVLPDQLVLSNGSNTLIQAIVMAIPRKSKIAIPDPTFSIYEHQALLNGNKVVKIELADGFHFPTDKFITTITREKPGLVFIANPNAPTGNLFDRQGLHRVLQAGFLTVIDEAYFPFSNDTVIDWLGEFPHLIVMRTFSKAFSLAGIRFGFTIADPEISYQIEKMLMPFRLSRITCAIVDEVLENPEYVSEYVKKIVAEKGHFLSKLQKIKNITVYPSDANFFLLHVSDAKLIYQKILKEGVVVRNVSNGTSLINCLRVNVGTSEENEIFLNALKKVV